MKRTYSEMKDSGVEWIGEIPKEWEVKKLKNVVSIIMGQSPDSGTISESGSYPFMQGCSEFGRIYPNAVKFCNKPNKISHVNDILMSVRAPVGKVNISDKNYGIGRGLCAIKAKKIERNFLWYFILKSEKDFNIYSNGSTFDAVTTFNLLNFNIIIPSLSEQTAIANYLDEKCAEIDSIISETKSCIEEYKQWKSAIIFETVTKGLDPNAEMKDSGVEWIGEIPKGWKVYRLKSLFSYGRGLPITKENLIDHGIPVISYGQIHSKFNSGVEITDSLIRFVSDSFLKSNPDSLVNMYDFIFADTSEDIAGCGNCVYVDKTITLFAGYHTIILRSTCKQNNKYLAYLFQTDSWRNQIRAMVMGVKLFSISKRILDAVSVIIPLLSEQNVIANYLDKKCAEIDEVISEKESLISELELYKKSLIYEVVTGKIKVS